MVSHRIQKLRLRTWSSGAPEQVAVEHPLYRTRHPRSARLQHFQQSEGRACAGLSSIAAEDDLLYGGQSIVDEKQTAVLRVADPGLGAVVRDDAVRALGGLHRPEKRETPAVCDAEDRHGPALAARQVEVPENGVERDDVHTRAVIELSDDRAVARRVEDHRPSLCAADEKKAVNGIEGDPA